MKIEAAYIRGTTKEDQSASGSLAISDSKEAADSVEDIYCLGAGPEDSSYVYPGNYKNAFA